MQKYIKIQLEYLKKYYGEPSKYIYGFAGGAYVNGENSKANNYNELYNYIKNNIKNSNETLKYKENMKIAKEYRIKFIAYEGGIDIIGSDFKSSSKLEKNFVVTEEMGELLQLHIKNWYENTENSLFMLYKSGASKNWGLTNSMDNIYSKKLIKIKDLIKNKIVRYSF